MTTPTACQTAEQVIRVRAAARDGACKCECHFDPEDAYAR